VPGGLLGTGAVVLWVRVAAGDAGTGDAAMAPSAPKVFWSSCPVGVRLFFAWKFLTAVDVSGPQRPSTWLAEKPRSLRVCCSCLICSALSLSGTVSSRFASAVPA
jgi:hypothetical protein